MSSPAQSSTASSARRRVSLAVTTLPAARAPVRRRPSACSPPPLDRRSRSRSNGAGTPVRSSRARVIARVPNRSRTSSAASTTRRAPVVARRRTARAAPGRRSSTPRRRAAGSACPRTSGRASSTRPSPDRLGLVGRLGQRPLAGDRHERRVAHLDRRSCRAFSPACRRRPATPSAMRQQGPLDDARGRPCPASNVCSWLTDFAASAVADRGRRRCPCARSTSDAPCLPNRRRSDVRRQRGQVADRPDPVVAQRRRGLLADAPQPRDRQRREERRLRRPAARRPARPACAGRRRSWRRAWSPPRRPTRSAPARPGSSALIGRARSSRRRRTAPRCRPRRGTPRRSRSARRAA